MISIVIINYNTQESTLRAVRLARERSEAGTEIIVIDNGSASFDDAMFRAEGAETIQNDRNRGFSVAANQGLHRAHGAHLLLLNSDAFVEEGAIGAMAEYLDQYPKVGIVGARMLYPNGDDQVSAGFFPSFLRAVVTYATLYKYFGHSMFLYAPNPFTKRFFEAPSVVDWVSGGCMMIRREVMEAIGVLDEDFFFGGEDLEYCFRARQAGWNTVFLPDVRVRHVHGASSGNVRSLFSLKQQGKGMLMFMQKCFPRRIAARIVIFLALKIKIFLTRKGIIG